MVTDGTFLKAKQETNLSTVYAGKMSVLIDMDTANFVCVLWLLSISYIRAQTGPFIFQPVPRRGVADNGSTCTQNAPHVNERLPLTSKTGSGHFQIVAGDYWALLWLQYDCNIRWTFLVD